MARAKRAKKKQIAIEASIGNVFEDLGLPDAGERLAKAEFERVIRNIVKDKKWTQRRAADVLGIAPPDVSDLMRGKLARFSQERLERFLNALGMDVRIQVGPCAAGKRHANVTLNWSSGSRWPSAAFEDVAPHTWSRVTANNEDAKSREDDRFRHDDIVRLVVLLARLQAGPAGVMSVK
jgi:predicted XRE-type DNA-binding protein